MVLQKNKSNLNYYSYLLCFNTSYNYLYFKNVDNKFKRNKKRFYKNKSFIKCNDFIFYNKNHEIYKNAKWFFKIYIL